MRFLKATFRNWKGFYYGLGLNEISFDFTMQKHWICLILGLNGSGKTTLEEGLTLFPDIYSAKRDATDFILTDEKGEKNGSREILFSCQGETYLSKIFWTNTTKCFLIHYLQDGTEEELNPNGNVRSYEELLSNKFGLTKNHNNLLFLGSGMNDIIEKIPSERKNSISKFTPNVDTYIEMWKTTTKYFSKLRNDIAVITSELHRLGDDKDKIKAMRENASNSVKNIQEKLTYLNTVKTNTHNITDSLNIGGKSILSIYEENVSMNNQVAIALNQDNLAFKGLCGKNCLSTSLSKEEYEKHYQIARDEYTKLLYDKEQYNSKMIEYNNLKHNMENTLASQESYRESYVRDNNPEKFIQEQTNLKEELDRIEFESNSLFKENPELGSSFEDILFNKDESNKFIMLIDNIVSKIDSFRTYYSEKNILNSYLADDLRISEHETNFNKLNEELKRLDASILVYKNKIAIQENSREIADMLKKIPSNCNNKDCIFVIKANEYFISNEESLGSKLIESESSKIEIQNKINYETEYLEKSSTLIKNIKELNDYIFNYEELISKFPNRDVLLSINKLFQNSGFLIQKAKNYSQIAYLKDRFIELTNRLLEIKDSIDKSNKYYETIRILDADIESARNSYTNLCTEIQQFCSKNSSIDNILASYITKNNELQRIINLRSNIVENLKVYGKIRNELKRLNKYYTYSKIFDEKLKKLDAKIENNKLDLQGATQEFNTCEYNLRRFEEFEIQKSQLTEEYNLLDTLRKCWSPTTGIPLIFIENYMNTLTADANVYLTKLWPDEDFLIKGFNIDEKNFYIMIDRNTGCDIKDASQTSGAERAMLCTVLSLALLRQLPKNELLFNILRFDEIDGALDYDRKTVFLDILDDLLNSIDNEQTFVISHSEIFQGGADVILLKGSDEYKKTILNGDYNVIYSY